MRQPAKTPRTAHKPGKAFEAGHMRQLLDNGSILCIIPEIARASRPSAMGYATPHSGKRTSAVDSFFFWNRKT